LAIIHNQRLIAQPAGLGGIVRHSYYGRFSRGFHAKDDFFNYLSRFLIKVAVGSSRQKTSGSMTKARAMPKRLAAPSFSRQRRPLIRNPEGPGPLARGAPRP
jgi:hypothetical protein